MICLMGIVYYTYQLYLNSNSWIALLAMFYMLTLVRVLSFEYQNSSLNSVQYPLLRRNIDHDDLRTAAAAALDPNYD